MNRKPRFKPYRAPAGGWGSVNSLREILMREGIPASGALALTQQNKPDGFQCVSCAWSKPANPLAFEYCENGAKATVWEQTTARVTPEFFARHTLAELRSWPDHDLEEAGRLTHPMRYDRASDTYVPVEWEEAFSEIGHELRALSPDQVTFYASGRASLEASYMYSLLARMYGTNNLPDSSNMCHETTSVALPESIGVPVGTTTLEDFAATGCMFFFGQNVGSNSPRMLHQLQAASRRGVPIISFNPLRERGLERFANPQSPRQMLTGESTRISSQYHQVRAGGDLAAITGICKALFALDDEAQKAGTERVLDTRFIAEHTHGFEEFSTFVRDQDWSRIEEEAGLTRIALEAAAAVYARSGPTIGVYGMGLTQHRAGVQTVQNLVNLLLLRGNIGRVGAGICPVRGHSNVQGQRTVGITEKPSLVPLDRIEAQFGFAPPREAGLNTVEACEAIIAGRMRGFVSLGGNFIRAVPDRTRMEPAWLRLRLSVQISTKLNRSHLIPGEVTYILPCRGRTEIDIQATGPQAVSIEDTSSCIHGSRGMRDPASPYLLSEHAIIAGIARHTLPTNPKLDWEAWVADYGLIRDAIAETYPEDFHDFNDRMWKPGGFHRNLAARERVWKTKTGKANFVTPKGLGEEGGMAADGESAFRLITLRSNDQFNTTIYGYNDRFRGVDGTRMVVFVNRNDMDRLSLQEGQQVTLQTVAGDGVDRTMGGFRVTPYNIPEGCLGAYYPEANALLPIWHYAAGSKTPAAKSIPVRLLAHVAAGQAGITEHPDRAKVMA
jgi:molybdopterin-dependent oxidoreductase alpha subunit